MRKRNASVNNDWFGTHCTVSTFTIQATASKLKTHLLINTIIFDYKWIVLHIDHQLKSTLFAVALAPSRKYEHSKYPKCVSVAATDQKQQV